MVSMHQDLLLTLMGHHQARPGLIAAAAGSTALGAAVQPIALGSTPASAATTLAFALFPPLEISKGGLSNFYFLTI